MAQQPALSSWTDGSVDLLNGATGYRTNQATGVDATAVLQEDIPSLCPEDAYSPALIFRNATPLTSYISHPGHDNLSRVNFAPAYGTMIPYQGSGQEHLSGVTHSFEHHLEPCPFPYDEHSHLCNGHIEQLPHPGDQEVPDARPTTESNFLKPGALDNYTAMERGDSRQSFASTTSRRSRISATSARYVKSINTARKGLTSVSQTRTCEECNRAFTGKYSKRNLTRHRQSVHPDHDAQPFSCEVPGCGRTYKRSDALRVHQGKVHAHPRQPRLRRTFEDG